MSNRTGHNGTGHNGSGRSQRLQRPQAHAHDKGSGAFVCDECRVVQHAGRWYWGAPPLTELHSGRCPACRRIHDGRPAGTLRLPKALLPTHPQEILNLILNAAEHEKREHPLERLMNFVGDTEGLTVTTTGVHLARVIAGKLGRTLHQRPRIHYEGMDAMHVDWPVRS